LLYYSPSSDASRIYVNELLKRDAKLISRMSENKFDDKNIYRIFRERLKLYERVTSMPLIEIDRMFLNYRRNEVCSELRLFKFIQGRKKLVGTNSQFDNLEDQYFNTPESRYHN
jgi:hypothetical protein